jgi:hypothetical protein
MAGSLGACEPDLSFPDVQLHIEVRVLDASRNDASILSKQKGPGKTGALDREKRAKNQRE